MYKLDATFVLRQVFSEIIRAEKFVDDIVVADAELDLHNEVARIRLLPIKPEFRDWNIRIYNLQESKKVILELHNKSRAVDQNEVISAIIEIINEAKL